MLDLINIASALITVVLGCFGWLAPRYTMAALDLAPDGSTMGMSEIRASAGALFVGLGLAALAIGTPVAFAMLGFAYAGAAAGRLTSILFDAPPPRKAALFFAVEAAFAVFLIIANL